MVRVTVNLILIFVLFLTACGNENQTSEQKNNVEYTKLTSNHDSTTQDISNQVKDLMKKREEITTIHAVNTAERLVVGFDVKQFDRFNLAKLNKEIKTELENELPKLEINVSTDEKIIIELEKLEDKLQTNSLSKKDLNKKLKKITDLSKEET